MSLLDRVFERPTGLLGKLGGWVMKQTSREMIEWVIDELELQPNHRVLEVGFGPGVGIEMAAQTVRRGFVAGVDVSPEMVEMATDRNREAVRSGRVELKEAPVDDLPYPEQTFDRLWAIDVMQVPEDPLAGLAECRRVLKSGGVFVLAFSPHSGQSGEGWAEGLKRVGFEAPLVKQNDLGSLFITSVETGNLTSE